ncbi:MAG: AAA family ATPase [Gemmatimonadota bacterium]
MILCRTLGPVEISIHGNPAPAEMLWRKPLALLIYLARSPQTRTREHLVGLFWSDSPESAARHSLNEALRVLRRGLGESALSTNAQQVRLAPEAITLDTDLLVERMNAKDWAGADALIAGEFMEGFALPDGPEFQHWLDAERRAWTRRASEALTERARELLATGAVKDAVDVADRGLRLDSFAEPLLRLLLRALALDDNRTTALERFETYQQQVTEDLSASPEAETLELVERIRKGGHRPRPITAEVEAVPPLVGRGPPMQLILKEWETARSRRRAALVMIQGEPGIGKTHLLDELGTRFELDGAAVLAVRAVEADQQQPESLLFGLARGGLLAMKGIRASRPEALVAFAGADPQWQETYGHITATPISSARALVEILQVGLEEQPAVLVLDDAQWADRDSLEALDLVLRDLARSPLLVIVAATPEPARTELDALQASVGRNIPGGSVTLGALSSADLRTLARWWFPRYTDPQLERLCRRVATDSAGIPLLAAELFRAVAAGLDLAGTAQTWPSPFRTLDHSLPADLPAAVVAAIRVRFRRLSQLAQLVTGYASVLDRRFDAELMGRFLDQPGSALVAALDELEWTRWLVSDARGYSFGARIMRDVVAQDMLTEGQRRRIRERVKELTEPPG